MAVGTQSGLVLELSCVSCVSLLLLRTVGTVGALSVSDPSAS